MKMSSIQDCRIKPLPATTIGTAGTVYGLPPEPPTSRPDRPAIVSPAASPISNFFAARFSPAVHALIQVQAVQTPTVRADIVRVRRSYDQDREAERAQQTHDANISASPPI